MEELGDKSLTVALFENFPIRRTWHQEEWYYSITDIVGALTASTQPARYWGDIKRRMKAKELKEGAGESSVFWISLSLPGMDGRKQKTDCATREGILRIIQSIPSPNAEPFKRWLARVGEMALEEIEETEDERSIRAQHRLRLHEMDTTLHEVVTFRGIVTPEQHQHLTDANYAGLYNVATEEDLIRIRRLPFSSDPKDFMGVLEMATNIFQRASTASLIHSRNLHGEDVIMATAEDVGVQIRMTLEKMGMPLPESLPRHRRLSNGEWMTEAMLAERPDAVNWEGEGVAAEDRMIPIYEVAPQADGMQELKLLEEHHIAEEE